MRRLAFLCLVAAATFPCVTVAPTPVPCPVCALPLRAPSQEAKPSRRDLHELLDELESIEAELKETEKELKELLSQLLKKLRREGGRID
jgi:DNA repair exonuclease SbcCD ATPase subunit